MAVRLVKAATHTDELVGN